MMLFNAARACILLGLLGSGLASTGGTQLKEELNANPIRRVVTMLQMMAKKVAAEGEAEEELFEKFMCYCKTGKGTLGASIADNNAKVPQVQSDIEEAESKLAQTKQELEGHQTDRDAAKEAMAKATAIREKEAAEFAAEHAEKTSFIAALDKAIPAIQKGMSGGFLQTNSATILKQVVATDDDLSNFDREMLTAFLQGGSKDGYAPKSGEILGILKQMRDTFQTEDDKMIAEEETAKKIFAELMAAKTAEVQACTDAIEKKTVQVGQLGVDIVNMKNDLSDAEEALVEDTKFLADMDKNCASKAAEWEERKKTRSQEIIAIHETIKILNDDDALELFKKTLPSPSLLQLRESVDSVRSRAMKSLKSVQRKGQPGVEFIMLALNGKKVDFSKVLKMIDDMVALLGKEQTDDDHKKEYCEGQIDFTEDKIKELNHAIEDLETGIADKEEQVKTLTEEIQALNDGITALDKSVTEATAQRKSENVEFQDLMASNGAAKELIEFAKNRMNKFYNPKMYKAPPKRELSEEERITLNMGGTLAPTNPPAGIAGTGVGFMQINSKVQDAPAPPPETFGAYKSKGEESGGVIGMMDLLVADLDKEITEAEVEEKNSQEEYEQMMSDAAQKRAEDSKSITEKEAVKGETEEALVNDKDTHKGTKNEAMATGEYLGQLHAECDWLIQNFGLRKDARAQEVEALKGAKAVLSGADYSLVQTATAHRH